MLGTRHRTAIVTGATGQDGYYLVRRLLRDGWTVHAAVRDIEAVEALFGRPANFHPVRRDLLDPRPLCALIGDVQPEEMYNLAGASSVAASFDDPANTWVSNAHVVAQLLDTVRIDSPATRFYQASSGEMFGSVPGGSVIHNEESALNPQSPYAAAKAAAHMLCRSYRESYGVRIACGILFNHESRRRGEHFLSRKVIDHLRRMRESGKREPLRVGNLKAERDWGFAPDYVDAMIAMLRQTTLRAVPDEAPNYRDYVLGTGQLHAVWQLINCAYALVGHDLVWDLDGDNILDWKAVFSDSGESAVLVDSAFVRPADPVAIGADPRRAQADLHWKARVGLDIFLEDMLAEGLAPDEESGIAVGQMDSQPTLPDE